jgi:hypothetical protein
MQHALFNGIIFGTFEDYGTLHRLVYIVEGIYNLLSFRMLATYRPKLAF